ncbi:SDR family NAD(P)-dependent oxidoreductase [Pseudomonas sp. SGAir0191]|uniref:SDR family NAD(P)-dependent oxidoreductase n=1 Tax=Pseudomonas TaxID=286 RepID=UPI000734D315|nr:MULTISPECIES: SDR family NAD(P)-dependent oxidoreductase [Pseudomonas]AUA33019.1 SDR family NAD(P)-dependent oxidoreductase [Pseudomonas sp. SGAir0191]KTS97014.1 retinol dehydrogenase [Pseudomonas parafulva]
MSKKSVLVTGASSGLGQAAALQLARNGFHVFAAARSIQGVFNGVSGIEAIGMDVACKTSVATAFEQIASASDGRPLWGLVNNAGICVPSPLELLDADELRRQLDTNVIGQLLVTQAALPQLRRSHGRVINVTSGLGSIAVPYLGAYSIAQFAKMAFTDALRRELLNSGVSVSVVQPGAIHTPIWGKFLATGQHILAQAGEEAQALYGPSFRAFLEQSEASAQGAVTTVDAFADVIVQVLTAQAPASHYCVGNDAAEFVAMARNLSAVELDALFAAQMPGAQAFAEVAGAIG